MADEKVMDKSPVSGDLSGTEWIYVIVGPNDKRVTIQKIWDKILGIIGATNGIAGLGANKETPAAQIAAAPNATALDFTETMNVVQSGATKKTTLENVRSGLMNFPIQEKATTVGQVSYTNTAFSKQVQCIMLFGEILLPTADFTQTSTTVTLNNGDGILVDTKVNFFL